MNRQTQCDCCGMPLEQCYYTRPEPEPGTYRQRLAAAIRAKDENQAQTAELGRRMAQVGVPARHIETLRAPNDFAPLVAARRFVDAGALFLVLIGSTGIGKSVAAAAVVAEACRRWRWNEQATGKETEPAHWLDARRLTGASAWEHADRELLNRLERIGLLVCDDMGDEGTQVGRELLVNLLIGRHAAGRRSVLTTNLTREAFKARYGEALADRIRSDGMVPALVGKSERPRRFGT